MLNPDTHDTHFEKVYVYQGVSDVVGWHTWWHTLGTHGTHPTRHGQAPCATEKPAMIHESWCMDGTQSPELPVGKGGLRPRLLVDE